MSETPPGDALGDRGALTRKEFDAVIRRAADLAASDSESSEDEGFSEREVFRIAREVGLSERHVRRALAEVRSGPLEEKGRIDRWFGPAHVRAGRVVPGSPPELREKLDQFLVGGQLLQPVRASDGILTYRPAVDWASQIARSASSMSKRYYTAAAKSVEIRLEEVENGRTHVAIQVDPGLRSDHVVGAFVGGGLGGAGIGTGVGVVAGLVLGAPVVLAVGLGVGVGVASGIPIGRATATGHRKKLVEVRSELEGILDRLETGGSLEPPPPSWRRWVKRHFHGVARDLMGDDEET